MSCHIVFWMIFISNFKQFVTSKSTVRTPAISSAMAIDDIHVITQFVVFATNAETVIVFEPEHGWMLNTENKLRLYISGNNLQDSALVFSSSVDRCTPNDFISPVYPLSSASIIQLDVQLRSVARAHSTAYICLLSSRELNLNESLSRNGTSLHGPYFTFVSETGVLPFPAKLCLVLMLFIFSGFFSGLNLGLMSLNVSDLHLLAESDDSSMRFYAKRVLPLRKRGNFLLCSIVLANVLANSLGTVLLDSLVHGLFAVIGSTIMIVIMGEIVPQAICSRYGLVIGARTHLITWTSMIVTSIVSYPLGFILNKLLGEEVAASYSRDQITRMLMKINADIEKPELDVITGVLSLRKKTVKEAMTMLSDVYMLEQDHKTDAELLLDVHKHGFSRIPVYSNERSNIIGIVKLRDFALIAPEQYHLTVKHVKEFHNRMQSVYGSMLIFHRLLLDPYGHVKATDSLYNLMQEFLTARWHIAMVQEFIVDEESAVPVGTVIGVITLEDVFEEMLQREIIEETDFFTDNRSKIQRKRAKTMDFTELAKRPVKGPSISPQLKVAVFQFLSTNIPHFTAGFISKEILKALLNYNIYATIKKQTSQTMNPFHVYRKGSRYELFTLIMQGNATLESATEHIISTVGPFSYFATSALLAETKTIKDVHKFLDHILTTTLNFNDINTMLDEISSIFVPDYNIIANSELQVLQVHRLVWLSAVRATQRQRSSDVRQRRMQPEQLLSSALDEISFVTKVYMDKTDLTKFQRLSHGEKNIKSSLVRSKSVVQHADNQRKQFTLESTYSCDGNLSDSSTQQNSNDGENRSSEQNQPTFVAITNNSVILKSTKGMQYHENFKTKNNLNNASTFPELNEDGSNLAIDINHMFAGTSDNATEDNHDKEKERLIDQGNCENKQQQQQSSPLSQQQRRRATSASTLFPARSDFNILISPPISHGDSRRNPDTHESMSRSRRVRSMLTGTQCSPS